MNIDGNPQFHGLSPAPMWNPWTCIYSARQLSWITLPVRTFRLTAEGNLCQSKNDSPTHPTSHPHPPLTMYEGPSVTSDWVLWPTITFGQSPSDFFLSSVDFQISPEAICCICVDHIQLWAVTVCRLPSHNKLVIMSTNTRPEIIVWFSHCGLSQGWMLRIIGVSQGTISKVLRHLRETRGYADID